LQAFEYRCLRKILRVPYTAHRTNTSIWDEVTQAVGPQEHLLAIVKQRKLTCQSLGRTGKHDPTRRGRGETRKRKTKNNVVG